MIEEDLKKAVHFQDINLVCDYIRTREQAEKERVLLVLSRHDAWCSDALAEALYPPQPVPAKLEPGVYWVKPPDQKAHVAEIGDNCFPGGGWQYKRIECPPEWS